MGQNAAAYLKSVAEQEVEIEGFTWVVRRMTKAGHARHFSGLQLLAGAEKDSKPTKEQLEESEQLNERVYQEYVLGIRDPETGEVQPVPYDQVTTDAFWTLWAAVTEGPQGVKKRLADIRGAL